MVAVVVGETSTKGQQEVEEVVVEVPAKQEMEQLRLRVQTVWVAVVVVVVGVMELFRELLRLVDRAWSSCGTRRRARCCRPT